MASTPRIAAGNRVSVRSRDAMATAACPLLRCSITRTMALVFGCIALASSSQPLYAQTLDLLPVSLDWQSVPTATAPAPRVGHGMVYDSSRNKVILFGGQTEQGGRLGGEDVSAHALLNDMWEWDPVLKTWSQIVPTSPQVPSPRSFFGMAYDPLRGRVVLYGGKTQPIYYSTSADTWEWDPAARTWSELNPDGAVPGGARALQLAFDPNLRKVILFGGIMSWGGSNGNTYAWDAVNARWDTVATSGPDSRTGPAMSTDFARSRVVLFGGNDYAANNFAGAFFGDTWEWDGTSWTLAATTGPSPRTAAAMAFDVSRRVTVLLGGQDCYNTCAPAFGDTWEWDGTFWQQRVTQNNIGVRQGTSAYDGISVLTFGGREANPDVLGDTHRLVLGTSDDDSELARLNGGNTFTGNQNVNGSVTATSFVGDGSGLTGIASAHATSADTAGAADFATTAGTATAATTAASALSLGGIAAGSFARLDIGNTFSGTQILGGDVNMTGSLNGTTAGFTGNLLANAQVLIGPSLSTQGTTLTNSGPFVRISSADANQGGHFVQFHEGSTGAAWAFAIGGAGATSITPGSLYLVHNNVPSGGQKELPIVFSSTGNVGINSNWPSQPLDVGGNIHATGTVTAGAFSGDGSGLTGVTSAHATSADTAGAADFATTAGTATTATTAASALSLGGIAAGSFARLDIGSTFSGTQIFGGNVNMTGNLNGTTAGFTGNLLASAQVLVGPSLSTQGTTLTNSGPFVRISSADANQGGHFVQFHEGSTGAAWAFAIGGAGATTVAPGSLYLVHNNVPSGGQKELPIVFSSTGNVGINSYSPSQALDVGGNIHATGTVTAGAFLGDGSQLTNVNAATATNATSAGTAVNAANATNAVNAANLGGIAATRYARNDASNVFTANQAITGNLTLSSGSLIANNGNVQTATLTVGGGTAISKHLSGRYSLTFASLNSQTCGSTAVTVPGAIDGDSVVLGIPNSMIGAVDVPLVYGAWVSSADTVTIRACNISASKQKIAAAGLIRVDMWKH